MRVTGEGRRRGGGREGNGENVLLNINNKKDQWRPLEMSMLENNVFKFTH